MGEFGGSHVHLAEGKVGHDVVNEDRSWMGAARTSGAEEGYCADGTSLGTEYCPYSCRRKEAGRECGATGAHRRARSASEGLRDFLFVDGIFISEDEYAKLNAKPESRAKRQCEHLRQPSLDAYSDPGYGDTQELPGLDVNSRGNDRVSNWLQDQEAGLRGDSQGFQNLQRADAEDGQLEFKTLSPGSIYRGPGDHRPLSTKAFDFVKKGAEGIASVSRTAAVEIAKLSRTTSMQAMELKNLATPVLAPVLAPILQAVIDDGRDQPTGPPEKVSEKVSEREHVQRQPPNRKSLLQFPSMKYNLKFSGI